MIDGHRCSCLSLQCNQLLYADPIIWAVDHLRGDSSLDKWKVKKKTLIRYGEPLIELQSEFTNRFHKRLIEAIAQQLQVRYHLLDIEKLFRLICIVEGINNEKKNSLNNYLCAKMNIEK